MTSLSTWNQLLTKYRIYGPFWTVKLTILFLYRYILFQILQKSYSQYGEDLVISRILNKKDINYVDVGANHPRKFNNTYHFYLYGGSGINIEPNPQLLSQYHKLRPLDTNLNLGISTKSGSLKFYQMYPDVNSTFSYDQCQEYLKRQSVLIDTPSIKVISLASVLDKHFQSNTSFDLLSIDTEGHDLEVLKSNNWNKYRPSVICVETQSDPTLHQYLLELGYKLVTKTPINSIYVKESTPLFSFPSSI